MDLTFRLRSVAFLLSLCLCFRACARVRWKATERFGAGSWNSWSKARRLNPRPTLPRGNTWGGLALPGYPGWVNSTVGRGRFIRRWHKHASHPQTFRPGRYEPFQPQPSAWREGERSGEYFLSQTAPTRAASPVVTPKAA